ncbi:MULTISPECIES: hypothetical protein [Corynebacterium]|uniref:hypothetical protein n=1 Tax=Corynebacterium TaxID=1716 RepID=UPI00178C2268|nr:MULTISPECIES: hypothetical protein [Corynebacterium]
MLSIVLENVREKKNGCAHTTGCEVGRATAKIAEPVVPLSIVGANPVHGRARTGTMA